MKSPAQLSRHILTAVSLALTLGATLACLPVEVDSLVTITTPSPAYRFHVAKYIRGSDLWRAYIEHLSSARGGSEPVASIDVHFERKITDHTQSGDYDAGVVYAELEFKELLTGATLLKDSSEFEISNYVIVREDATRDEVQDAAFTDIEEKAVRYIVYSMDLALIRAMGREPSGGAAFISVLEEVRDKHWSVGLQGEAATAIAAIRSPKSAGGSE